MSDVRTISPSARCGDVAESGAWGNLLLGENDAVHDEEFVFEGEGDRRYWITRVNVWPLDASKRLFHYETHPRSKHSSFGHHEGPAA